MMTCRVDLEGEGQGQVNAQDSTVEEAWRLEEVEETVLLEVLEAQKSEDGGGVLFKP